jgi:hypothetical protein
MYLRRSEAKFVELPLVRGGAISANDAAVLGRTRIAVAPCSRVWMSRQTLQILPGFVETRFSAWFVA